MLSSFSRRNSTDLSASVQAFRIEYPRFLLLGTSGQLGGESEYIPRWEKVFQVRVIPSLQISRDFSMV